MTIGEVAKQAGLATSAIRYYESIGLLPAPNRVNGRRIYHPDILKKLAVIQLARQVGFSIEETHTLLHAFPADTPPSERWQQLARQKITELDTIINQMTTMKVALNRMLQCRCDVLEACAEGINTVKTVP